MQAAHYRRVARERRPKLDQYARQLERLGYRVVRVPELRVRRNRHEAGLHNLDISYCNALPGLHRGAPALYYMPWGIPAIDRAAARQMRAAGVTPVAVSTFAPLAHGMMELAAGLRCFCGSLP